MKATAIVLGFFVFLAAGIAAAGSPKISVAVPEFQNSSGKLVNVNRWDLAVWMANEMDKTHAFKAMGRKDVLATTKDAEWSEDKLPKSVELKLQEQGARYVIYGAISDWRLETAVVSRRYSDMRGAETGPPGVYVVFNMAMVDLSTGKTVKEFLMDGNAIGPTGGDDPNTGPPYLESDARFAGLFEEATKVALRKAARNFAQIVDQPDTEQK